MTRIYIYDTGHAKTDNSDTQVTQANGGQPLALWGSVRVSIDTRNNIDKAQTIDNRKFGTHHYISSALTTVEITGLLTKKGSSASQITDTQKLIEFKFTPSYKILYVAPDSGESAATYDAEKVKYAIYHLAQGHKDSGANFSTYETTYEHIHIWIEGLDIDDGPYEIRYRIYGVVTD